ncbi:hypothetical protein [Streptomyces sp. NPDC003006]
MPDATQASSWQETPGVPLSATVANASSQSVVETAPPCALPLRSGDEPSVPTEAVSGRTHVQDEPGRKLEEAAG